MKPPSPTPVPAGSPPAEPTVRERNAGALFGLWLALVVTKLGNPVIFSSRPGRALDPMAPPADVYEVFIGAWPVSWGYPLLFLLGLATLLAWRRPPAGAGWGWAGALLLGWLGWQGLSALTTVDAGLTQATLRHFAAAAACFAAGWAGLGALRDLRAVWFGLAAGLAVVVVTALDQHFWGLERTRAAFEQLPEAVRARLDTPEFRVKLASQRVFGTFVYPNALAGGLLLFLSPVLAGLWASARGTAGRWLPVSLLGLGSAGALYWSGSKSGWLLALAVGCLALLGARLRPLARWGLLAAWLGVGLLAFFGRHAGYFEAGASSMAARRDYWRAGLTMIQSRPWLGYGPGTFQIPYREIKPPQAEMARLAHNDYLQQACDAGVPAMLAYAAFVFIPLWRMRPAFLRWGVGGVETGPALGVWLGMVGFAGQGLVEFGLYIPALAWPFFLWLGWLWRQRSAGGEL